MNLFIDSFATGDDLDLIDWDQETGRPTVGLFSEALQVWCFAQDHPVTIAEAAVAFRVTEALIVEAIESHPWMYVDGAYVGHEGE